MRQVWIPRTGGPEVLEVREAPDPEPSPGEIRVRVEASGINFADILARMGLYPDAPPLPAVVGYEVAGVVDALGEGVESPSVGDRVMSLTRFGGYSDVVCVPARAAAPLPANLDSQGAASIPVNYLTAWLMLVHMANVRAGERVLVHACAGGVGLAAVQICRLRGARIVGTASAGKHERLVQMGVEHCIDYRNQDFEDEVRRLTDGKGVDVALDAVGGKSFAKSYRSLSSLGRLLVFGVSSFAPGKRRNIFAALRGLMSMPSFKPIPLMNDNKGVFGVNLGHLWRRADLLAAMLAEILGLFADGTFTPALWGGRLAPAALEAPFRSWSAPRSRSRLPKVATPDTFLTPRPPEAGSTFPLRHPRRARRVAPEKCRKWHARWFATTAGWTEATMAQTLIEKILSNHSRPGVGPGDTVDVRIDTRAARDFGGANVVKNLERAGLAIADPGRTLFTFDCNPGGSDQGYAANQQLCRVFARSSGVELRDIDQGIGTHLAIEEGKVWPGSTFVSTDSHANIMGAVGAFGQGMGDQDIAAAWANGAVWFKVPTSVKVVLEGTPGPYATAKDLVLAMLRQLGANGLLGHAAEICGDAATALDLVGRITVASMATEMGGITVLFTPDEEILDLFSSRTGRTCEPLAADPDADYADVIEVDVDGLGPMISRPGHPEDVVPVSEVAGRKIDSVFIGSCTNGRLEDLRAAAEVLRGRKVAPGVVLKVVPATRRVWDEALEEGIIRELLDAGALIGNAGCAGCAAGQIGQNGPGEVTVSTGNRNYPGKQGKGEVYLASPVTAAASAAAGVITTAHDMPTKPVLFPAALRRAPEARAGGSEPAPATEARRDPAERRPTVLRGRVWVIDRDNVDTDMIFHNRHLAITDVAEMGRHTFGNLEGWEDFSSKARPDDIVVVGANFGCGSSRQQAVDCFSSLGVSAIVARSYGAIYERNAINAGLPVVVAEAVAAGLKDGDEVTVDLETGVVSWPGGEVRGEPFSEVQMAIYHRGGLLAT